MKFLVLFISQAQTNSGLGKLCKLLPRDLRAEVRNFWILLTYYNNRYRGGSRIFRGGGAKDHAHHEREEPYTAEVQFVFSALQCFLKLFLHYIIMSFSSCRNYWGGGQNDMFVTSIFSWGRLPPAPGSTPLGSD